MTILFDPCANTEAYSQCFIVVNFLFFPETYIFAHLLKLTECYSTLETMHKISFWDYDMAGRSRSRLAFFLLLIILLTACADASSPDAPSSFSEPPFRAFYHWQTEFTLDALEQAWLDSLSVDRIYVKFFDLDWDETSAEVIPLAPVELDTTDLDGRRIIPTLFLTNRSMLQVLPGRLPLLAERITAKIDRQFAVLDQPLTELQLDCDWTAGSRANYFALLEALKKNYAGRNVALSTTIRLHQLRYPEQTGVPPVPKGVLMFYNMGDLQDWSEPNSILNLEKAAPYLPDGLTYPMHLDLALPLFRWGVLFREGKMIKLINEPNETALRDSQKFRSVSPNRYEVLQSTYLDGYYLYQGDQLRMEVVSPEQLQEAYGMVRRRVPAATRGVIFYHLDREVIQRYRPADLVMRPGSR